MMRENESEPRVSKQAVALVGLSRVRFPALFLTILGVVLGLAGFEWGLGLSLTVLVVASVLSVLNHRQIRANVDALQVAWRSVHEKEERLEMLGGVLGTVGDAVLAVKTDGTVIYANEAVKAIYGYSPDDLIGGCITRLCVPAEREETLRLLSDGSIMSIIPSKEVDAQRYGVRADGSTFPGFWITTITEIGGEKVYTFTVRDHTDFVENQRAMSDLYGELRSKVDTLETVVTRASEGNLSVVVPEVGDETLGRLGRSLGKMVGSLRELVREVQRSGMEVAGAANDLAETTDQHESSASEQAAAVGEISTTARRIFVTSQALVETVAELDARVQITAERATRGRESLERMHNTMDRLSDASQAIGVKLSTLSDKASNITSVVQTIARVADQTNLLSLNAAIEAEKAGEYGRGFSVVASEIRRLADQTAVATLDIERIVKEIQSAVDAGVVGMEHLLDEVSQGVQEEGLASDELTQIISQVGELGPHFTMVCERMQSQSDAAAQISDAVDQLGRVTQNTAVALSASGSALQRLNEAATGMQRGVTRFELGA